MNAAEIKENITAEYIKSRKLTEREIRLGVDVEAEARCVVNQYVSAAVQFNSELELPEENIDMQNALVFSDKYRAAVGMQLFSQRISSRGAGVRASVSQVGMWDNYGGDLGMVFCKLHTGEIVAITKYEAFDCGLRELANIPENYTYTNER